MPYRVVFAPEASDQLEELLLYIAERSSMATADNYAGAIVATCEGLAHFPCVAWRVKISAPAFGSRTTWVAR